ncbi:MAG: FprA family A-type flavoprotein [Dysgonamonadaceae bacterium]|jgi:flavorubredoxin|nr:FprA family A-type flavoprotein [Dysgonamonadaceae bacterium]
MKSKEIAKDLFYVGVNDRQKSLFENLWPLPAGVSYNSYLMIDQKTALFDTVDICYADIFLKKIAALLDGRKLDYLIVNHMEPDHSGSIRMLKEQYPDLKIVGNAQTFKMLEGFHGIAEGLHEVKEGDTLDLGRRKLQFLMAPMVHWPEVMFTIDLTDHILFSADAFGTFGALSGNVIDTEMNADAFIQDSIRYYSNIVGKYGNPVQRALKKVKDFEISTICTLHGPVWRERIPEMLSLYERLSRYEAEDGVTIAYGSMYGNTEQMAEAIALSLSEHGVRNIAMHNTLKSHASYILSDIFRYRGLIIGSPTYSNQIYPDIESLLSKIEIREVKNRYFGCFGSFSWAGAAVKRMGAFAERMNWETVGAPVEQRQGTIAERFDDCWALGAAMAGKVAG